MDLKLPLFSFLCVLAFTKATARPTPSSIENLNAAAVSANLKQNDYAPLPPAMLEVEGPDIKHGTALRAIPRWIYCIAGTVVSSVCIGLYRSKPETLRHNRLVTLVIFILNFLCWIPNIILELTDIPLIPYIPWTVDDEDPQNHPPPPSPHVHSPQGPSPTPPAVTPQRSPIYDWLRLPRKAVVCPACKRTAADLYAPSYCTQCGIGSSRVNCRAAEVLERSGFAH